ncbi:MAG: hypothetical protein PHG61_05085 [Candidatus Marinimicrobia bacterium]|nr:hypothetical protein [Candidatus Neomarinimicrobiota bacterium]
MIVSLTVKPRISVINFLNTRKGFDLSAMRKALKIVGKLELTKEDRERVNFKIIQNEESNSLSWDTTKDRVEDGEIVDIPVDIDLSDEQAEFLAETIQKAGDAKELTVADAVLLDVYDQLKKV